MPKIGKRIKGRGLGKKGKQASHNYIWAACEECGLERWVAYILKTKKPRHSKCLSCGKLDAGKRGEGCIVDGYNFVRLPRTDPLFAMARRNNYIAEHRIVMARHLGRCLEPKELVHHLNGIKDDNRIENLMLVDSHEHGNIIAGFKERIATLEKQQKELLIRIRRLELLRNHVKINSG